LRVACRTLEDLQAEYDLVKNAADRLEGKVEQQWISICERLKLDNKQSWRSAMPCIMGRLSQQLYPYRPKLSILLQYWKRPAGSIDSYMTSLMQCKDKVRRRPVLNSALSLAAQETTHYCTGGMRC
jgi:hypothetical protein